MGGTGNRAVLTLHKCNTAMVCLKILFVYNIFHFLGYRYVWFIAAISYLSSPCFGDRL